MAIHERKGDACGFAAFLYWGRIIDVNVNVEETTYTVADLTPVPRWKTQQLVLRSTQAPIAAGFIDPTPLSKPRLLYPRPKISMVTFARAAS